MEITAVFVYGTLKQGEERGHLWPHDPTHISPAIVQGRLYDLGPYPAMVPGDEMVAGELWHFAADQMRRTLTELDRIEDCNQGGADYYVRVVVECETAAGREPAFAYHFASEAEIAHHPRVKPNADGVCVWKPAGDGASGPRDV